jgi:F0F1-type ATP synthase assembly protein I
LTEIQSNRTTKALLQLALLQFISTVAFSLTIYVCFTSYEGLSALFGGLVAVLANMYVALKARKPVIIEPSVTESDELAPAVEMLQRFYRFEVTKILLTLTMFAICVVVLKVSVLPFIIAYVIAALIVTWLSLLVVDRQEA